MLNLSACLEFHPWEKIQQHWHWSQLVVLNCLPLFVFVHFQFELLGFDDAVVVAVLVVEHVLHHRLHAQARLDATFALCHLQLDELPKLSPTQHNTAINAEEITFNNNTVPLKNKKIFEWSFQSHDVCHGAAQSFSFKAFSCSELLTERWPLEKSVLKHMALSIDSLWCHKGCL